MTIEASPDSIYALKSEIILPENLHKFIIDARTNTWASEEQAIQVPGRIGFNKFEYRDENSNFVYEDEFYDNPDVPGVFFGSEVVKTNGKGGRIFVAYNYSGELTEHGIELGEGVVFPKLQYFLRKYADKARFGQTFEVEHRDEGKWTFNSLGTKGKSTWSDKEYIRFGNETVYTLNGAGTLFLPAIR